MVRNSENGIIFDTKNKKSTEAAFEFIMTVPFEWLSKAGKLSLEIARKSFTCSIETGKLIKCLENMLDKPCNITKRRENE